MTDVRDHITKGVTRSRLKLEARRSVAPVVLFVVGILVALPAAAYLVVQVSHTFLRDTYQLRFAVADDFGLFVGHDEVRFRGVPAGTISKIDRTGTQLVLTATIQKRYAPIYRNARAALRAITPLNDVYLDITDPGTPSAGRAEASDPLPEGQTETLVTVPDVLDTLGANERTSLHTLLDQLGNGLAHRGNRLRQAFIEAVPLLEGAGELTRQLAVRRKATKRLVHNTALLTDELAGRETMLRRLVSSGAATLGTLQQGAPDLDSTIKQLPATLTELVATLRSVRGVVGDVDHGLTSLYPVADRLPGALAAVGRLNASLAPAVRSLQRPVRELAPLARTLRPAAADLGTTAAALRPQVPTLDRLTQRLVDCEKGIQNFFQWNASLSKFGDSNGPIPRGNLAFGVPDLGTPGVPRRQGVKACTPGPTIGSRAATPKDEH